MRASFEPYIAFRYLRSKRKEVFISIITIISILGVAISVLVLDIVLAVMTGFEVELQAKLLDAHAHIVVRDFSGNMHDWEEPSSLIGKTPGVVGVEPYTYSQAMISSPYGAQGILIKGIADQAFSRAKLKKLLGENIDPQVLYQPAFTEITRPDGSIDQVELPPLVVGKTLYDKLGLNIGAPVTILSPELSNSPQGLVPKLRRFVLTAVYQSGLAEYESGLVYTNLKSAQQFFGYGSSVAGLEVSVSEGNLLKVKEIAQEIKSMLSQAGYRFNVSDWTEPNKALWQAIELEKRVYFIVLLLLVLVASFSIVSGLVMVVIEKSKDIAILKSIGATDKSISRIFLIQGSTIGILGTLLGTILGYLGCIALREYGFPLNQTVFSVATVPVNLVPINFFVVAISGFLITSLAGIYPARRAAKLDPAEALRYE